jgi:hypothetical protein
MPARSVANRSPPIPTPSPCTWCAVPMRASPSVRSACTSRRSVPPTCWPGCRSTCVTRASPGRCGNGGGPRPQVACAPVQDRPHGQGQDVAVWAQPRPARRRPGLPPPHRPLAEQCDGEGVSAGGRPEGLIPVSAGRIHRACPFPPDQRGLAADRSNAGSAADAIYGRSRVAISPDPAWILLVIRRGATRSRRLSRLATAARGERVSLCAELHRRLRSDARGAAPPGRGFGCPRKRRADHAMQVGLDQPDYCPGYREIGHWGG